MDVAAASSTLYTRDAVPGTSGTVNNHQCPRPIACTVYVFTPDPFRHDTAPFITSSQPPDRTRLADTGPPAACPLAFATPPARQHPALGQVTLVVLLAQNAATHLTLHLFARGLPRHPTATARRA